MMILPISISRMIRGLAPVAAMTLAMPASAVFTWDGGGGDDLWTTGLNWDGDVAPALDLASDTIIFGATGGAQSPDAGADNYINIAGLSFTNADATLTLIGTGSLSFDDAAAIVNDSTFAQNINIDLIGTVDVLVINADTADFVINGAIDISDTGGVALTLLGSSNITLNGVVSGAGGSVVLTNEGIVTIVAANTYDGGTTIGSGTVVLGDDTALGTGAVQVIGDAAMQSDDDARAIANDVSIDDDVTLTFSGANNLELAGVISGDGGIAMDFDADDDTLTLSGTNTFTGGSTLTQGTVVLADDTALGTATATVDGDVTLQSDDDTRSIDNNIAIDGAFILSITGGNDLTLTGTIAGAGGLEVNFDAATDLLTLGAQNNFAGGVTLAQGTIAIGNNNALGAGTLSVTGTGTIQADGDSRSISNAIDLGLAGTLTVAGDEDMTLSGVISGDGVLNINTNAVTTFVTLSGDNTFTGGTTITSGSVVVGNDNAFGTGDITLAGDVGLRSSGNGFAIANDIDTAGNILFFAGTNDLAIDGIISGAGGLTFNASDMEDTLTLTGANTYTGNTAVNTGTLQLDGSITSDVTLGSDGALTGTGTVTGNVTATDGSMVSPGTSVGTLTIDGNYEQQDGATLMVELDGETATSDLLDVSGTATLASGSIIQPTLTGVSFLSNGDEFTIIDAAGGVTDNGAILNDPSATLSFNVVISPDFINGDMEYILTVLRNSNAFENAADPGNNTAIGQALDTLVPVADADPGGEAASFIAQLDALDSAGLNTALSELDPESYNGLVLAAIDNIRSFNAAQMEVLASRRFSMDARENWQRPLPPMPRSMLDHTNQALLAATYLEIDEAEPGSPRQVRRISRRVGSYAKFRVASFDLDSGINRTGYSADYVGGQAGVDYRVSDDAIVGIAVDYTNTDGTYNSAGGSFDTDTIRVGPYATWQSGDLFLDASVTGAYHDVSSGRALASLGSTASADYDGFDISAFIGAGWELNPMDMLYVTPRASVQYSYFDFGGYTETGAAGANMTVAGTDSDSLRTRVGVDVAYRFDAGIKVLPSLFAGWEHEFSDNDDITARFVAGGSSFTVDTGSRDDDAFYYGGGIDVLFDSRFSGYLRYEQLVSDDSDGYSLSAGLRLGF